jgi:predicted transcriptional regulator
LSAPLKQRFARPSRVETSVLESLLSKEMTSPEVRGLLGSSREHAARVMKSLTDNGLVMRETSKKPYVYQISDAGRDMVTNGTASGS